MTKIIPKFEGHINELGKLELKNRAVFKQYLITLKGDVEIIVKRKSSRKTRSNEQNKYYWGVVLPLIAQWMGDTPESTHDALRMLFLKDISKRLTRIKSTTELTTSQFEEYMKNIREYMAIEYNVYIPLPNEYWEE